MSAQRTIRIGVEIAMHVALGAVLSGCAQAPRPSHLSTAPAPVAHTTVAAVAAGVTSTSADSRRSSATGASIDEPTFKKQFAAALDAMRDGRDEEARAGFTRLFGEDPGASGVATNLGILDARAGHGDTALVWFGKATQANPRNVIAWVWLGSLYRQGGHLDEARHAYAQALAQQPDCAPAHLNLAILCEQNLHDQACAAREYQAYLKLVPQRVIAYAWLKQAQTQTQTQTQTQMPKGEEVQ